MYIFEKEILWLESETEFSVDLPVGSKILSVYQRDAHFFFLVLVPVGDLKTATRNFSVHCCSDSGVPNSSALRDEMTYDYIGGEHVYKLLTQYSKTVHFFEVREKTVEIKAL